MSIDTADRTRIFLSTVRAQPADERRAKVAALVFGAIFLAAAPFARTQMPQVGGFVSGYQSALILSDFITGVLLFAQFAMLRAGPLLVLAVAYLFAALMGVVHALTFPGLFAPEGLLGAGAQTTSWIYIFWHGGFPIAILVYVIASAREKDHPRSRTSARLAIAVGATQAVVTVAALAVFAIVGHSLLPAVMADHHYTGTMLVTMSAVSALTLTALLALWWRRPHSLLDLWLIVVLVAWLCDIGLSTLVNTGRFDLGYYIGRMFGLMAASFVLVGMLLETGALYARVAREFERATALRESLLRDLREELIHVSRLNELGQMVSALSHELNQPLTAANNYVAAARALLTPDAVKSAQVLDRAGEQLVRASRVIDRLRQLVKKGEVERRPENLAAAITETIELAFAGGQGHGISLNTSLDPTLPQVLIDRVQIQQVLLNLLRNAIEAMAGSPRRDLVVRASPRSDGMVEISVADSGPGLAAPVREKLFEPFQTTKATGMGVGLSICRTIVESHGGRIWATDRAGGGTAFHFLVPCVKSDPAPATAPEAMLKPAPST